MRNPTSLLVAAALVVLAAGCQYENSYSGDDRQSCQDDNDCDDGTRCLGLIADPEIVASGTCTTDGYIDVDSGAISTDEPEVPSVFFICSNGRIFYPICTPPGAVPCGASTCAAGELCATYPSFTLDDVDAEAYCVTPWSVDDWQDEAIVCESDLDCGDEHCKRLIYDDQDSTGFEWWICVDKVSGQFLSDKAECGNGVVEPGELCDDGNILEDDGCNNDCLGECRTVAGCDDGLGNTSDACEDGLCVHT